MQEDHYASSGCIRCGADLPIPDSPWVEFGPKACPKCGAMHEYSWDTYPTDEDEIPVLLVELLDFQDLLRRYIRHVRRCEGCDFINSGSLHDQDSFTADEWVVLRDLAK